MCPEYTQTHTQTDDVKTITPIMSETWGVMSHVTGWRRVIQVLPFSKSELRANPPGPVTMGKTSTLWWFTISPSTTTASPNGSQKAVCPWQKFHISWYHLCHCSDSKPGVIRPSEGNNSYTRLVYLILSSAHIESTWEIKQVIQYCTWAYVIKF